MSESPSLMKRIKAMPPVRLIVVSFFLIILVGTLLLMTPAAARDGRATSFVDALFTATSATCVTGLVPFDTWTHWSHHPWPDSNRRAGRGNLYHRLYHFGAP